MMIRAIVTLGLACALYIAPHLALSGRAASSITVDAFGARGNGSGDNTLAFQSAINSCQGNSGCQIVVPCGRFVIRGKLEITASGVAIVGTSSFCSILQFANGDKDDFYFHGPSVDSRIQGFRIANLRLAHARKSGGAAIHLYNVAHFLIDNVVIIGASNGILVDDVNNVSMRDTVINLVAAGASSYGIKCYALPDGTQRAVDVSLSNVVVEANYQGADGLVMDGRCRTVRLWGVALLHTRYGLSILNTAHSRTDWPAFLYAFDLEVDGATAGGVRIEGGREFHFGTCDISDTRPQADDGDAMAIYADASGSVTSEVYISNSRIGNAGHRALYSEARDVVITGTRFFAASKAEAGRWPAVEFGPGSENISVTGGQFGASWNGRPLTSYGISIDQGARWVNIIGPILSRNLRGGIDNQAGAAAASIAGSMLSGATAAGSGTR
jgi:hypothetical protein